MKKKKTGVGHLPLWPKTLQVPKKKTQERVYKNFQKTPPKNESQNPRVKKNFPKKTGRGVKKQKNIFCPPAREKNFF